MDNKKENGFIPINKEQDKGIEANASAGASANPNSTSSTNPNATENVTKETIIPPVIQASIVETEVPYVKVSRIVNIRRRIDNNFRSRLGENTKADDLEQDHFMYIGSAFAKGSSDVLRGLNFAEEIRFLPKIIGISSNSDKWEASTRLYWANIRKYVQPKTGVELETGFQFVKRIVADKEYTAQQCATRFAQATTEETKALWGEPINIPDYILYRHCLVYSKVANSEADIYKSPNIRFYMTSKAEVQAKASMGIKSKQKAMQMYLSILNDRDKIDGILFLSKNKAGNPYNPDTMSDTDKDIETDWLSTEKPDHFVNLAGDSKLGVKTLIERAINKGVLKRIDNTDVIYYGDNTLIGNNMNEAVMYMENAANTKTVALIKTQVKSNKEREYTDVVSVDALLT